MDSVIFLAFAIAYLVLIFSLFKIEQKITWSSVLFLVLYALVYDNLILGIGRWIGEGTPLEALNFGLFWLHALFTPTLIIFSIALLQEADVQWAKSKIVIVLTTLSFLTAVIVEFLTVIKGLSLAPVEEYGALSYTAIGETTGPPLMIILVIVTLLLTSITLIKRFNWWWMLIGILFMSISAMPIEVPSNSLTNFSELFLSFTLVLSKKKIVQRLEKNN